MPAIIVENVPDYNDSFIANVLLIKIFNVLRKNMRRTYLDGTCNLEILIGWSSYSRSKKKLILPTNIIKATVHGYKIQ